MSRVEHIGAATLYLGDCREVLPALGRFDVIVTDPPYGEVNRDTSGLRDLYKGAADICDFEPFSLAELFVAAGDTVYIWCGFNQVSPFREALTTLGMSTRACVWEKTNPSPMNGQFLWLSSVELCVFGKAPGAKYYGHCASPVWRIPSERDQVHPTQKPAMLMARQLLASSAPGGSVADPFMGSGTTGIAAVQHGRTFVGIERDSDYFDIACRRIDQAQRQGQLFGDAA